MKIKLIQTIVILAASVVPGELQAQYTLDWSAIGSGGGALSGGNYTLKSTVGQPIAGNLDMVGGSYQLSSGFWSIIQSTSPPFLAITHSNGEIVISWPLSAVGYSLEQTSTALALPSSWATISPPYDTNATSFYFPLALPSRQSFFRLRKP